MNDSDLEGWLGWIGGLGRNSWAFLYEEDWITVTCIVFYLCRVTVRVAEGQSKKALPCCTQDKGTLSS